MEQDANELDGAGGASSAAGLPLSHPASLSGARSMATAVGGETDADIQAEARQLCALGRLDEALALSLRYPNVIDEQPIYLAQLEYLKNYELTSRALEELLLMVTDKMRMVEACFARCGQRGTTKEGVLALLSQVLEESERQLADLDKPRGEGAAGRAEWLRVRTRALRMRELMDCFVSMLTTRTPPHLDRAAKTPEVLEAVPHRRRFCAAAFSRFCSVTTSVGGLTQLAVSLAAAGRVQELHALVRYARSVFFNMGLQLARLVPGHLEPAEYVPGLLPRVPNDPLERSISPFDGLSPLDDPLDCETLSSLQAGTVVMASGELTEELRLRVKEPTQGKQVEVTREVLEDWFVHRVEQIENECGNLQHCISLLEIATDQFDLGHGCPHIERLLFDLEWLSYIVYSEAQLWELSLAAYQEMDSYSRFKLMISHCSTSQELVDLLQDSAIPFAKAWATSQWGSLEVQQLKKDSTNTLLSDLLDLPNAEPSESSYLEMLFLLQFLSECAQEAAVMRKEGSSEIADKLQNFCVEVFVSQQGATRIFPNGLLMTCFLRNFLLQLKVGDAVLMDRCFAAVQESIVASGGVIATSPTAKALQGVESWTKAVQMLNNLQSSAYNSLSMSHVVAGKIGPTDSSSILQGIVAAHAKAQQETSGAALGLSRTGGWKQMWKDLVSARGLLFPSLSVSEITREVVRQQLCSGNFAAAHNFVTLKDAQTPEEREAMQLDTTTQAVLVVSVARVILYDSELSQPKTADESQLDEFAIADALRRAEACLKVLPWAGAFKATNLQDLSAQSEFVATVDDLLRLIAAMKLLPSLGVVRSPAQVLEMEQKMQLIEEVIRVHRHESALRPSESNQQFGTFVETVLQLASLLGFDTNENQLKVRVMVAENALNNWDILTAFEQATYLCELHYAPAWEVCASIATLSPEMLLDGVGDFLSRKDTRVTSLLATLSRLTTFHPRAESQESDAEKLTKLREIQMQFLTFALGHCEPERIEALLMTHKTLSIANSADISSTSHAVALDQSRPEVSLGAFYSRIAKRDFALASSVEDLKPPELAALALLDSAFVLSLLLDSGNTDLLEGTSAELAKLGSSSDKTASTLPVGESASKERASAVKLAMVVSVLSAKLEQHRQQQPLRSDVAKSVEQVAEILTGASYASLQEAAKSLAESNGELRTYWNGLQAILQNLSDMHQVSQYLEDVDVDITKLNESAEYRKELVLHLAATIEPSLEQQPEEPGSESTGRDANPLEEALALAKRYHVDAWEVYAHQACALLRHMRDHMSPDELATFLHETTHSSAATTTTLELRERWRKAVAGLTSSPVRTLQLAATTLWPIAAESAGALLRAVVTMLVASAADTFLDGKDNEGLFNFVGANEHLRGEKGRDIVEHGCKEVSDRKNAMQSCFVEIDKACPTLELHTLYPLMMPLSLYRLLLEDASDLHGGAARDVYVPYDEDECLALLGRVLNPKSVEGIAGIFDRLPQFDPERAQHLNASKVYFALIRKAMRAVPQALESGDERKLPARFKGCASLIPKMRGRKVLLSVMQESCGGLQWTRSVRLNAFVLKGRLLVLNALIDHTETAGLELARLKKLHSRITLLSTAMEKFMCLAIVSQADGLAQNAALLGSGEEETVTGSSAEEQVERSILELVINEGHPFATVVQIHDQVFSHHDETLKPDLQSTLESLYASCMEQHLSALSLSTHAATDGTQLKQVLDTLISVEGLDAKEKGVLHHVRLSSWSMLSTLSVDKGTTEAVRMVVLSTMAAINGDSGDNGSIANVADRWHDWEAPAPDVGAASEFDVHTLMLKEKVCSIVTAHWSSAPLPSGKDVSSLEDQSAYLEVLVDELRSDSNVDYSDGAAGRQRIQCMWNLVDLLGTSPLDFHAANFAVFEVLAKDREGTDVLLKRLREGKRMPVKTGGSGDQSANDTLGQSYSSELDGEVLVSHLRSRYKLMEDAEALALVQQVESHQGPVTAAIVGLFLMEHGSVNRHVLATLLPRALNVDEVALSDQQSLVSMLLLNNLSLTITKNPRILVVLQQAIAIRKPQTWPLIYVAVGKLVCQNAIHVATKLAAQHLRVHPSLVRIESSLCVLRRFLSMGSTVSLSSIRTSKVSHSEVDVFVAASLAEIQKSDMQGAMAHLHSVS